MKVEELRLLIKEVVQETMREELSSILTEAVQIASTPSQPSKHLSFQTPSWVQEMDASRTQQVAESKGHGGMKSPMDMIMSTAKHMSREDLKNFM